MIASLLKRTAETAVGLLWGAALAFTVLATYPVGLAAALAHRARRWHLKRTGGGYPYAGRADLLVLASRFRGLTPTVLGRIALAQARLGRRTDAQATFAQGHAALAALKRRFRPQELGIYPELEEQNLGRSQALFIRGEDQEQPDVVRLVRSRLEHALERDHPVRMAAETGDLTRALNLARREPRDPISGQPAIALAAVALRLSEVGRPEATAVASEAVEVAASFSNWWPIGDDSGYRERSLRLVSLFLAQTGDLPATKQAIARILDPDEADRAAADVALLTAEAGRMEEAVQLLWWIVDADLRAITCLDLVSIPS